MIQQGANDEALRGTVFNIQGYSIHDGPGIRTTVFLKGCPLKCFWCQNPESQRKEPEVFLYKEKCTLCRRCVTGCPIGASAVSDKGPRIDRKKCAGCGKCAETCPTETRKLIGKYMTVDMVMREILKDVLFYKNSGGGVTLSGGEPSAQPEFTLTILQRCKEVGLHTTLDTCGYVEWPLMEKLLRYTDLVLYDIKCMGARKHHEATGRSNRIILENAKKIARNKAMRVRVPIIPGFNDSAKEIQAISHFSRVELGSVEIDLLPYNPMGEIKYERLDRTCVHLEARNGDHVQILGTIVSQARTDHPRRTGIKRR
jgi:pyruvate formate lyase activating enzyme